MDVNDYSRKIHYSEFAGRAPLVSLVFSAGGVVGALWGVGLLRRPSALGPSWRCKDPFSLDTETRKRKKSGDDTMTRVRSMGQAEADRGREGAHG